MAAKIRTIEARRISVRVHLLFGENNAGFHDNIQYHYATMATTAAANTSELITAVRSMASAGCTGILGCVSSSVESASLEWAL